MLEQWQVACTQLLTEHHSKFILRKTFHTLCMNDPFDIFSPENFRQVTLSLSKSSLLIISHHYASLALFCVGPCSATVVATLYFSDCLSGRRQEILVTLTAAAPFLLSSSNDVDWLWWHEVRNWAPVKVRKIGQCLCLLGWGSCWGYLVSSFLYCFSFRSSFYTAEPKHPVFKTSDCFATETLMLWCFSLKCKTILLIQKVTKLKHQN